MARSRSILIVDDNKGILTSLQFVLGDRFAHVLSLSSPQGILPLLERQTVDVVLLDMNFFSTCRKSSDTIPSCPWCCSRPLPTSVWPWRG